LEDVGFGDPLSAAVALEANHSHRFRQQLGELKTVAAVATDLALSTKSRSICDALVVGGTPTPSISAGAFRAHIESHAAPWLVRYLALRGFSHAALGTQVLPVWAMLGETVVTERKPDPYGDELIA